MVGLRTQKLWVNVEAPPWKRPYIRAGGKALGVFQKRGVSKELLQPDWKAPFRLYHKPAPAQQIPRPRPQLLAQWKQDGGSTLFATAVTALLPEVRLEELHSELTN